MVRLKSWIYLIESRFLYTFYPSCMAVKRKCLDYFNLQNKSPDWLFENDFRGYWRILIGVTVYTRFCHLKSFLILLLSRFSVHLRWWNYLLFLRRYNSHSSLENLPIILYLTQITSRTAWVYQVSQRCKSHKFFLSHEQY